MSRFKQLQMPNTVKVAHLPAVSDVPFPVDVQLVVEYYANRV